MARLQIILFCFIWASATAQEIGDCFLELPRDPLSAEGLATPYILKKGCRQEPATGGFVEALIWDAKTNEIFIYHPLVIEEGTVPAIPPLQIKLPRNAIVALWFGTNAASLTLLGRGVIKGKCVNGNKDSIFGQFAACNAVKLIRAVNKGRLQIPALGTGADGNPCPTTRDFLITDAEQADNCDTEYLVLANGQTAQDNTANRARLAGQFSVLINGGDNRVKGLFDVALGCTTFTVPDLSNPGRRATSLVLAEFEAAQNEVGARGVEALIPAGNPFVLCDPPNPEKCNLEKLNLYRVQVNFPKVKSLADAATSTTCHQLIDLGLSRLISLRRFVQNTASPNPAAASNLFTFMLNRFQATFDDLECPAIINTRNPITTFKNQAGVVISVRVDNFGDFTK